MLLQRRGVVHVPDASCGSGGADAGLPGALKPGQLWQTAGCGDRRPWEAVEDPLRIFTKARQAIVLASWKLDS